MAGTELPEHRRRLRMLRVLIVDDNERIRHGLRGLFELVDDIEVVAEATNGDEAVAMEAELRPDVVLMDLSMPVMGGLEATRMICASASTARILIVTAMPGQEPAATAAGADGFLLKDADPSEILSALRSMAQPMPLGP